MFRSSLAALCLFLFLGCAQKQILLTRSRLLMGHVPVTVRIMAEPSQRDQALQAGEAAYALAASIESKISEFQADSEITCLNRNAGREFCRISDVTMELLQRSVEISGKTDHAFDIRFGSPTAAGRNGEILIDERRHRAMLIHAETHVGVGAIGKGLIVDKMMELLAARGFPKSMVQAGGDLRGSGMTWKAGIQVPGGKPGDYRETFLIHDEALATSGTYEQGNHILDPRTSRPVERQESVTVRAHELWLADALATACFVLGKEGSLPLLERFPKVQIYWTSPLP
jgi:thiamine biosynthesis lipoprotein